MRILNGQIVCGAIYRINKEYIRMPKHAETTGFTMATGVGGNVGELSLDLSALTLNSLCQRAYLT